MEGLWFGLFSAFLKLVYCLGKFGTMLKNGDRQAEAPLIAHIKSRSAARGQGTCSFHCERLSCLCRDFTIACRRLETTRGIRPARHARDLPDAGRRASRRRRMYFYHLNPCGTRPQPAVPLPRQRSGSTTATTGMMRTADKRCMPSTTSRLKSKSTRSPTGRAQLATSCQQVRGVEKVRRSLPCRRADPRRWMKPYCTLTTTTTPRSRPRGDGSTRMISFGATSLVVLLVARRDCTWSPASSQSRCR